MCTVTAIPKIREEVLQWRIGLRIAEIVAKLALCEGGAYNWRMQYTLRNIPEMLDSALRERAKASGKSLNEVALEALGRGLGLSQEALRHRDLSDLAGTWRKDPAFDRAIADQHAIDGELWK